MIDEAQHDLAVEYVLGELTGEARREFEAWLASDREMQILVDEIAEATAALAHAAPLRPPPASLRATVIGRSRKTEPGTASRSSWIPWTIAALATAATAWLGVNGQARPQPATSTPIPTAKPAETDAALQAAEREKKGLAGRLQLAEIQATVHVEQIAVMRDELTKLRNRNAVAPSLVATLAPASGTQRAGSGCVVWDAAEQRGLLQLANLPPAPADREYHLWLLDASGVAVGAGAVTVTGGGTATLFRPRRAVENAASFALTLEAAGHAGEMTAPAVLSGAGVPLPAPSPAAP